MLHEGQHSITRENGRLIYRDADGVEMKNPGPPSPVATRDRDLETTVPAWTDTSGFYTWQGDDLDLDFSMDRLVVDVAMKMTIKQVL